MIDITVGLREFTPQRVSRDWYVTIECRSGVFGFFQCDSDVFSMIELPDGACSEAVYVPAAASLFELEPEGQVTHKKLEHEEGWHYDALIMPCGLVVPILFFTGLVLKERRPKRKKKRKRGWDI